MSERFLITQSLFSSWKYQFSDFYDIYTDSEKAEQAAVKAHEDFLSSLRREKSPTTEAQQRGHDFEELVTRICEGKPLGKYVYSTPVPKGADTGKWEYDRPNWGEWIDGAQQIADKLRGGVFQVTINAPLVVGGIEYLLHGRLDVLKQGTIYDIKYSSRYEYGNFYDSAQHPMYFAIVPEAHTFTYLVYCHGNGVFEESYRREDTRNIAYTIVEFMDYLDTHGLTELYREKWLAL